jgi:GDP-4-dehydro-6-deoxy-D-mannose reductase
LVTGARGFVGRHLLGELGDRAVAVDVDIRDGDTLGEAIRSARPSAVAHLAARSSVADSWERTAEVWSVNTVGTVNLLDAVRVAQPSARVLVVSTGEVYGRAASVPTPEDSPLAPLSPYAASKVAAEIACGQAVRADRLEIVMARSFMHAGPGQDERFAIGSWTRQVARLEAEGGGTLWVGELSTRRDIVDVRDVCRAYRLLLDPGLPPGTYNVASGNAVSMEHVLELLVSLAHCAISVERDPDRSRPADVPVLCGDPARLTEATGWIPRIPLDQTLADALDDARRVVGQERMARA